MHLSLNILKSLVDLDGITPEEIGNRLTMSTAEIEGIEYVNQHFSTIVTAKLLEVKKHPDSDHLTMVKADTGKAVFDVICGAPNHKTGDIAALALEGTRFSEDFVIKKTKIRGVESTGMLCSAKELGLSEEHSGIIIFPEGTPIGKPLSEIYADWVDVRIEIDNKSITHRPDLWGHAGFARELSAVFGRKLLKEFYKEDLSAFKGNEQLNVIIDCPNEAPRYCGLVMKNIKIAPSPEWLQAAVTSIGMRPINNIVDITNYVMAELGEPMHAFDRTKLDGNTIIVRLAKDGEKISTLDGSEHTLCKDDIVIADKEKPIAVAGVMGGGNSEIDDNSTEIVLEAANFSAVNIRKTAHRFVLRTDAAMRFEKSLDPELCPIAIKRCHDLIKQIIPGAEAVGGMTDTYPHKKDTLSVTTTCDHIRKKLGAQIPDERIIAILRALEFVVTATAGKLDVIIPSYRATKDISIEADIVEEIGRVFGYDNITPVPPMVACETPQINDKRWFEKKVKRILSGTHNMIEVYNYSFTGETLLNKAGINNDKELRLRNPLSVEHDRLRRSLVPGILSNIEFNSRFNDRFAIYELARTYNKQERTDAELAQENFRICGAFSASGTEETFFHAKTAIVDLFEQINLKSVRIEPTAGNLPTYVHPKRSARILIDGKEAGLIFDIHPATKQSFEIKQNATVFDIDFDAVFSASKKKVLFTELQKYPDVPFELSVICEKTTYAADIADTIRNSAKKMIKSIDVISVYEGAPIPDGKKSVSFMVVFGTNDKTLSPEEITTLQNGVMDAVRKKNYTIR